MKYITLAVIAVLLTCGFQGCRKEAPPSQAVIVDPSLKVRCPFLESLDPSRSYSFGEVYTMLTDLQGTYTECAIRNDCLIEGVEKAEGKTDGFLAICPKTEN